MLIQHGGFDVIKLNLPFVTNVSSQGAGLQVDPSMHCEEFPGLEILRASMSVTGQLSIPAGYLMTGMLVRYGVLMSLDFVRSIELTMQDFS